MIPALQGLGRRLRAALIGGGEGALIGPAHRIALRFDNHFEIVAGVVSGNPERAMTQGRALGLPRFYPTLGALLDSERGRTDAAEVAVVTAPNDAHFAACMSALNAGLHVICDKPVTNTLAEAEALRREAATSRRLLFVTYNYTGYAMIRQARAMLEQGEIGTPHLLDVRYAQGNLGTLVERSAATLDRQLSWRLDPARGGAHHLLLDIGVHAENLATYVAGRQFSRVFADVGAALPGRGFADSAVVLGRLEGEVRASLAFTKAATGAPQVFGISVFGDKGGLSWEQARPNELCLMRQAAPVAVYTRGVAHLSPLAARSIRSPAPHPEGFREAFANIYADFAERIAAEITGWPPDPLAMTAPTIEEGVRSIRFVDACAASCRDACWVDIPAHSELRT